MHMRLNHTTETEAEEHSDTGYSRQAFIMMWHYTCKGDSMIIKGWHHEWIVQHTLWGSEAA